MNALKEVFLYIDTMLYTQYIDTAVRAYAAKTFGQQKNEDTNRFELSELTNKFLALYRNCRYIASKEAFADAYTALDERAKYGENSDNDSNSDYDPVYVQIQLDTDINKELDIIVRPIENPTTITTIVKDTPERQQKIVRYLQTAQQVYKEKYVKVQTNKLRHFGYDMLSSGKSVYKGLKVQTTSSRNNTLIFFIKLALFYDSYLDRKKAKLSYTQNKTLTAFVYKEYYYKINTIVDTRALYYIQKQKQKLKSKLKSIRTNRHYEHVYYSRVFIRTIGIDCSYRLKGKEFLTTELFDKFQIIPGTYDTGSGPVLRLLELPTKLRKRAARLIRSYATGTGILLSTRDPTSAERNNPNNRHTLVGEEDNDTIQLARRNSNPQVPIDQQANRRIGTPEGRRYCQYSTSYVYGRYIYLKNKIVYDSRYKYKAPYRGCKN